MAATNRSALTKEAGHHDSVDCAHTHTHGDVVTLVTSQVLEYEERLEITGADDVDDEPLLHPLPTSFTYLCRACFGFYLGRTFPVIMLHEAAACVFAHTLSEISLSVYRRELRSREKL